MPAHNVASGRAAPGPGRDLLELVDTSGQTVGVLDKLAAHTSPGHLHRAFSVFLFDDEERLLLQRRALGKYHSPGVWSNTCCGHPFPGEPPAGAAARRVKEELGIAPVGLAAAGTVRYALPDPKSGLIEREYNHVFVGRFRDEPRPDPAEVSELTLVTPERLRDMRDRLEFSVWFPAVIERAVGAGRTADLHLDAWR
ncbi:isopentenyl-diphosphate Delta-isomerase [Streptomyces sp. GESEQ-4]|uniref:isopentenyl-diphosphate Delta-isomerase n=1 Tax=Streptomyces sp. GESEQ-4 TaxID=2812655 RepID=UPI001FF0A125|nr:isopentenyl-diphosphate Delta-isomerase [Streptomyces sp. GESEQ-4]